MAFSGLTPTQYFEASVEEAIKTCTWPTVIDYQIPLPGGHLTVHKVFEIVTSVAAIINISIALFLFLGHLLHWTRPLVQKQQARVVVFIIVLSVINVLSVVFYSHSPYLEPIGELYEGFAIVAVFLFYVQITASDAPSLEAYFHELDSKNDGGVPRFRRTCIFVFQIAISRIITLIAFEVLVSVVCPISKGRVRGHFAITALQGISTALAVLAIIRFEVRMKEYLRSHKSLMKLWAFKVVIVLNILQNFVFDGLALHGLWKPSAPYYVSYNDFLRGLPQVLFTLELTVAAIVFLWAYEFSKYRSEIQQGGRVASGPVRALASTFNPSDIIHGIVFAATGSEKALTKALGGFSNGDTVQEYDTHITKGIDSE